MLTDLQTQISRRSLRLLSVAILLASYPFFIGWMAEHRVIEAVMAAGMHTPPRDVAIAILFILIRVLVVFILPAALLSWIWLWLTDSTLVAGR